MFPTSLSYCPGLLNWRWNKPWEMEISSRHHELRSRCYIWFEFSRLQSRNSWPIFCRSFARSWRHNGSASQRCIAYLWHVNVVVDIWWRWHGWKWSRNRIFWKKIMVTTFTERSLILFFWPYSSHDSIGSWNGQREDAKQGHYLHRS